MPNDQLTRIPASRVPITDVADGTVTREWYRYLFNLFTITGQDKLISVNEKIRKAINKIGGDTVKVTLQLLTTNPSPP